MEGSGSTLAKAGGLPESKPLRVPLRRRSRRRREGNLAAALTQSMALAVLGTAGAYPSWVLVKGNKTEMVLGAVWAIQKNTDPGSPVLGPTAESLLYAIAFCCLLSALTGSLALTLDFLGPRRGRTWAPLLHGITALLIACSVALGSSLFAVVRKRTQSGTDSQLANLTTRPGQGLLLAFLACTLAAAATGLSCMSPALVEPARSSWDFGTSEGPQFLPTQVKPNDCRTDFNAHLSDLVSTENPPEARVARRRRQEAEKWRSPELTFQGKNKNRPRGPESEIEQKARRREMPDSDLKPGAQRAHAETYGPETSRT